MVKHHFVLSAYNKTYPVPINLVKDSRVPTYLEAQLTVQSGIVIYVPHTTGTAERMSGCDQTPFSNVEMRMKEGLMEELIVEVGLVN